MTTPKMTHWFPPHIKPEHKGVYQVRIPPWSSLVRYAKWNGRMWSWMNRSPAPAQWFFIVRPPQDKSWRGFTEKQS